MNRTHRYLHELPVFSSGELVDGPSRVLDLKGRRGLNPTSIHTSVRLGPHNLNAPRGTLQLWFFALEDLAASYTAEHMAMDNPYYEYFVFLSDQAIPRQYDRATFCVHWHRYNELRAKFFRGNCFWDGFNPPQKAWVQAVPFNYFRQHRWYQLTVTWDEPAKLMDLYVNGVLVGRSDRFNRSFLKERAGEALYAGCPALCHGEVELFDEPMEAAEVYRRYRAGAPDHDPEVERELRHVFEGADLATFDFFPGQEWALQWDCDLRDPAHVDEFYVQGHSSAVKRGGHPDGLLIETPDVPQLAENLEKQVYLWSHRNFEGDLYLEYEWMALKPNGLSLLMVHASGMCREDFMADYPKKTTGKMLTVHAENVRNYHWEYYREMNDVRNDVITAFSRKNPFSYRIGFGSGREPVKMGAWNKLQLTVINGHVRGAINGEVLLEYRDQSRTNTGCILNFGHIAIRCMVQTKLLLRNLKVYTRSLPFTELPGGTRPSSR